MSDGENMVSPMSICNTTSYEICASIGDEMVCQTYYETTCDGGSIPIEHLLPDYEGGGHYPPVGPGGGLNPPNPCDDAYKLAQNQEFIDMLNELKALLGDNREYGYTYTKSNSTITKSTLFSGAPNGNSINFSLTTPVDGIAHTHYAGNGMMSIFTVGDVYVMTAVFANGKMNNTSTFTYTVQTTHGTQYSLKIDNVTLFKDFVQIATEGNWDSFEESYANHNIMPSNSNSTNEKGFIKFLKDEKTGLSLFRGNAQFDEWKKLKIDSDGNVVNDPC